MNNLNQLKTELEKWETIKSKTYYQGDISYGSFWASLLIAGAGTMFGPILSLGGVTYTEYLMAIDISFLESCIALKKAQTKEYILNLILNSINEQIDDEIKQKLEYAKHRKKQPIETTQAEIDELQTLKQELVTAETNHEEDIKESLAHTLPEINLPEENKNQKVRQITRQPL